MTQEQGTNSLQNFLGKWENHLNDVRKSDSLSETEKAEVFSGVEKLRKIFGDAWLWETSKTAFLHPLMSHIANCSPRSQLWLADFGEKLDIIKELPKFEGIVKRLQNHKQYTGAEAEVQVAAQLVAAGINKLELSPEVMVHGKPKNPDIKAALGEKDIYFEVATLGELRESVKAAKTFNDILSPFDPELIRFAQLHKWLSKPHTRQLQDRITRATTNVKETKEYEYVGEQGVLDYLLVHPNKRKECEALLKRFGMKNETVGPPVMRDDIARLERELRQKGGQLPKDSPAIIVLFGAFFWFAPEESFYEDLVSRVQETIYDQDNVVAGIIIDTMQNVKKISPAKISKPHYNIAYREQLHGLLQETVLVIRNRYARFDIDDAILSVFTD